MIDTVLLAAKIAVRWMLIAFVDVLLGAYGLQILARKRIFRHVAIVLELLLRADQVRACLLPQTAFIVRCQIFGCCGHLLQVTRILTMTILRL